MPSGSRRVDAGTGGSAADGSGPDDGGASFPVRPRRARAGSLEHEAAVDPGVEEDRLGRVATGRAAAQQGTAEQDSAQGRAAERSGATAPSEATSRWAWRDRLRQERPRLHRLYRVGVGVVGGLLLVTWALVSWLPGPGGIPLLLLALAVLSTEFRWARRLLERARVGAHRFAERTARMPLGVRLLGSAALVVAVLTAVALGLAVVLGLPGWVPDGLALQLVRLPGVDPRG